MPEAGKNLKREVAKAVNQFWSTRIRQAEKQTSAGKNDQGSRGAVTGGAQMDGFSDLITKRLLALGVAEECIFYHRSLELPGFYRPTKRWDLLVVMKDQLLVALEMKSQVGPSFGNNFNNRTEEAMGSALDLWTAFRAGALNKTIKPWIGYLFLLEDCPSSRAIVELKEPHFKVLPEFVNTSYANRYELFCRKLVRENLYSASAFILSQKKSEPGVQFLEPGADLTTEVFLRSLSAHVSAYVDIGNINGR